MYAYILVKSESFFGAWGLFVLGRKTNKINTFSGLFNNMS